jgi:hypothetical protein
MSVETFQIHLSSALANKYNDGLTSDCEFNLPTIEIPSNYHIHVSVENFACPYTFYNINSSNNYLVYNDNGNIKTHTITSGNYSTTSLINNLLQKMTTFTITYSPITNKITFSNTYDFSFYASSTCLSLLGFSGAVLSSTNNTLTSDICVNLSPYRCICIASNLRTFSVNTLLPNNQSILASIPINTAPNSVIIYENKNNFKCNTYTNIINTLRIRLMDHKFNTLDLNGCHWTITLKFDIIDYVY